MIIASLRAKILPALCLVVFAASSMHVHGPLAHDEAHSGPSLAHAEDHAGHAGHADRADLVDAQRLSSDDAHHEHHSRTATPYEVCLACRSGGDEDSAAAPASQSHPLTHLASQERGETSDRSTGRPESGASGPRAPPERLAPVC